MLSTSTSTSTHTPLSNELTFTSLSQSLLTPYEILIEELPGKYHSQLCALSGPSFAKEVALNFPTNVTVV